MGTVNRIHPSAIIGAKVELGSGNVVGPGVVIVGSCRIGDDNWIGPYAVLGTPAEMRGQPHPAWDEAGDRGELIIGDGNVLRDFVNIHAPHFTQTVVGDGCYIMNNCYIGHDGYVGDGVTLASTVVMGGHCRIGAGANVGLAAALHQRSVVGPGAMVGMSAVVTRPVPPFAKAWGNPCRVRTTNDIALAQLGIDPGITAALESLYRRWGSASSKIPELPAGAPPQLSDAIDWYRQELDRAAS